MTICSTAILLSVCALAQSETTTVRKVTVTLATSSTEASKKPTQTQQQGASRSGSERNAPSIISVVSVEPTATRHARRRHIEYSEDQIIVVGLAADSTELTRTVMIDPRLIRAEALFGENDLPSGKLYRPSVDFAVSINDPAVITIRILLPRWNGSKWEFDAIAETPLR